MKKYQKEDYKYESIKEAVYPWVKEELTDHQAVNGKNISVADTPVISFVGNLKIIFVIKRGEDTFEVLKDDMLPPGCSIEELYHQACENLNREVEFVIGNTLYGAFAIIADGHHECSSLCFKHIWQVCVDKLDDDLVLMAPAKDMVLFAPAGQEEAVRKMADHGRQAYEASSDKISQTLLRFSKDRKELTVYEKEY